MEHGAYGSLSHLKRQLINQDFFDETIHFASDLFRNKKGSKKLNSRKK